jgi:sugar/nucleoside kinase (ribokinase family)
MTKHAKNWDVVVIGEFFIDEIFSGFQALPKLGEEAFARKFRREIGGGAAITASALAKLGLRVAAIGAVGKEDGGWVSDRIASFGVDTAALERNVDEPTGVTISLSTREERAFFSYYGANEHLPRILRQSASQALMGGAQHIHFACAPDIELDAPLFPLLRRRGCRISIDVQSHFSGLTRADNLNILRHCDLFLPNEREAEWISGEAGAHKILRVLRERGLCGVGLKLGGKGAALLWKKRELLVDPHPVETVDTTGAGDCFNAGFIYAWLKGKTPQECLEVANLCGALSTRTLGGLAAFPSVRELDDLEFRRGKRKP